MIASKLNSKLKKGFTAQECKEQWEVLQEELDKTGDMLKAAKEVGQRQEREEKLKMALNEELEESKPFLSNLKM